MTWEYRELTIPLGVERASTVHGHLSDPRAEERGRHAAREQYAAIVGAALHAAAAEGWQPAEPADFDAAARAGRLRVRTAVSREATAFTFGEVRATTITHVYESVTLLLKRPAP
jgi:hypothetical protein